MSPVAIDDVIDKKAACIDALESQFYEWNPWLSGYEAALLRLRHGPFVVAHRERYACPVSRHRRGGARAAV